MPVSIFTAQSIASGAASLGVPLTGSQARLNLDNVRFNPTAGGVTDWIFAQQLPGCVHPSAAGIIVGRNYRSFALAGQQWETSVGVWTGNVLIRSTVLYNSDGTGIGLGQSGAGAKVNFSAIPVVSIVGPAEGSVAPVAGDATGSDAKPGDVGEYIENSLAWGSGVTLVNGIAQNVTSITLTPGDWDVYGVIGFQPIGGGTPTQMVNANAFLSTVSNTIPAVWPTYGGQQVWIGNVTTSVIIGTDIQRFRVSVPTIVYLVADAAFNNTAPLASGHIRARRMR